MDSPSFNFLFAMLSLQIVRTGMISALQFQSSKAIDLRGPVNNDAGKSCHMRLGLQILLN
ncbi:uncharacterized protein METZ01_LOCUS223621 [marine metagenome]|uniref:Uncharacterized protein n=1 Tax=marine metagenome TaxID=408172 RepID=A0A382G874_9ZZZZ